MSRSLRHPFKGSRRYLRPDQAAGPAPQAGPAAEAPPEPVLGRGGARRPGHHRRPPRAAPAGHRAGGRRAVRVLGTAPVDPAGPPGPGRRQGGHGQPDPGGGRRPDPGPHPRPVRQPAGGQQGGRADHPVPGRRPAAPRGRGPSGRPASARRTAQIDAALADPRFSPYKPVPVLDRRADVGHPLHQGAPGRLPRCVVGADHRAQLSAGRAARPGAERLPGRPDARVRVHHQRRRAQVPASRRGTRRGTPFGQSGLEYQYEPELRGTPGRQELEVDPHGRGGGHAEDDARPSRATTW